LNLRDRLQLANCLYDNKKNKDVRNDIFLTTPLTTWHDHYRTRTPQPHSSINMNWAYILSAGLTLTLLLGLALLYYPELFPTHLLKRWAQHFHYFGH